MVFFLLLAPAPQRDDNRRALAPDT